MNTFTCTPESLSDAAKQRILSCKCEPLFYADWLRTVFIHYEVDAEQLQREVPFELDLHQGRAYISLVAFTMQNMRPCIGGKLGVALFKPIATHEFLNVRTYVRHQEETGIYFLAEWLPNPLSVLLGPRLFGLPYRLGRLEYEHQDETGVLRRKVTAADGATRLEYCAELDKEDHFAPCQAGSAEEFVMERYTAFTYYHGLRRFFRIWHSPWPQKRVDINVSDASLLQNTWPWFKDTRFVGANYSPGVVDVWMGRPYLTRNHLINRERIRACHEKGNLASFRKV